MIAVRKDEEEEEEEVQRSYEHVYGRTILIKPEFIFTTVAKAQSPGSTFCCSFVVSSFSC